MVLINFILYNTTLIIVGRRIARSIGVCLEAIPNQERQKLNKLSKQLKVTMKIKIKKFVSVIYWSFMTSGDLIHRILRNALL